MAADGSSSLSDCETLPPIPEDPRKDELDDCRLWIGNIHPRITEFTLLKLLQKYGSLKKFDFLYNKTGPDQGKPRGYCFVSYDKRQDAEKALKHLNGKVALDKRLIVKWAHAEKEREKSVVPQSSMGFQETKELMDGMSAEAKIQAIESKLLVMEHTQKEFTLSHRPVVPPGSSSLSIVNQQKIDKPKQQKKPYRRNNDRR